MTNRESADEAIHEFVRKSSRTAREVFYLAAVRSTAIPLDIENQRGAAHRR
jgi:hypothetical protein